MTAADVGYHCPECVAEGRVSVRTGRTVFGGRIQGGARVTSGIIATCVVLFLAVSVGGAFGGLQRWGMNPLSIALLDEWFRLASSIFLHVNWIHIGFNMYVLFLVGPPLERVLGHGRFLALFLISGLGGSVASYLYSDLRTLSVGASGAIFGLMAAMIVVGRRLRQDVSQVIVLLGINVALGFVLSGIDWRAHLGGAATGAVVALILTTGSGQVGRQRVWQQAVAAAVVLAGLAALAAWRTDEIRSLLVG
jgi:membrane associated rhomboid family serine protease